MAITLLPKDSGTKTENKATRKLLNIGAGLLAGYLVVMAVVAGIFLYVSLQQKNLIKTREALAAEVKNNQSKEEKYVLLKDRISALATLPDVLNFREVLDLLPELVGNNLTVEGINLSGGQLKIVIDADDTFELEELVANINKSSKLTQVTMENLDLADTGEFVATLSVKVK